MRLPVFSKPSPLGEGGPAGPDEGRVCHGNPFTGNRGKVFPHQSAGGAADSFPRGGSHCAKNAAPFSGNGVSIYYTKVSATNTASSRRISLRRFCRSARRSVGEVNTIPSSGGAAGSVNCKLMPGPSPTVSAQPMALV